MDEDPFKNNSFLKEINPRPLLECLDIQSTFQKRKKSKTFERTNSNNDEQIDSSPGKVRK
jgi:hypothetical protein